MHQGQLYPSPVILGAFLAFLMYFVGVFLMFRVLRCPKIENGIKRPKMNIHKWSFFEEKTLSPSFGPVCLKLIFSTRNYPAIANAPEVSERQECQFTHNTKDMLSTWHVTKCVIPVRHEIQILSCSQLTEQYLLIALLT